MDPGVVVEIDENGAGAPGVPAADPVSPRVEIGFRIAAGIQLFGPMEPGIGEIGGQRIEPGSARRVRTDKGHPPFPEQVEEILRLEAEVANLKCVPQRPLHDRFGP
jgi:hypothetical protein